MKIINETFKTIQNNDTELKLKYFNEVLALLKRSYEPIGGLIALEDENEILRNDYIWKLVLRNSKVSACALYRGNMTDRKLVLAGQDGSEQGKKDLYMILDEDIKMKDRCAWAELSGALEYIYLNKLNGVAINSDEAIKIMKILGKQDAKKLDIDDIHYVRKIGDDKKTKVLVGNLPDRLKRKD